MNTTAIRYPRGILASCCIPWSSRFEFMEDIFRDQLRLILSHTSLVYIMGTAGEGYAVSDEHYSQIVRVFADVMRSAGAEPMVGLINLSVATMQHRIDVGRELGVNDFQISLPSWGELSDTELSEFFAIICDRNPECRFLHYNLARSKRVLSPEEYKNLEQKHPNLVATKNGTDSMRYLAELMSSTTGLRHFITDIGFPYAAQFGECGLLIAISSCNWSMGKRYYESAINGDFAATQAIQHDIIEIRKELMRLVLPSSHMDGAFDKIYAKLHQPEFPLRLYPPYVGCSDDSFSRFSSYLRNEYSNWLQK